VIAGSIARRRACGCARRVWPRRFTIVPPQAGVAIMRRVVSFVSTRREHGSDVAADCPCGIADSLAPAIRLLDPRTMPARRYVAVMFCGPTIDRRISEDLRRGRRGAVSSEDVDEIGAGRGPRLDLRPVSAGRVDPGKALRSGPAPPRARPGEVSRQGLQLTVWRPGNRLRPRASASGCHGGMRAPRPTAEQPQLASPATGLAHPRRNLPGVYQVS
jgi:hypothetical protein